MHAGREADHQQPRPWIAEGQHRPGMVVGVGYAYFGEEAGEARTVSAVEKGIHSARIPAT